VAELTEAERRTEQRLTRLEAVVEELAEAQKGESKTQLKKTNIDAFIRFIKKAESVLEGEKMLIAVTYQASLLARKYAEQKGIKLYFSYELPL